MDAEQRALLPCPFCGGRAANRGPDDYGLSAVFCHCCGAEVADDILEKAQVTWNTRALTQAQPGWRVDVVAEAIWRAHSPRAGRFSDQPAFMRTRYLRMARAALAAAPAPQQGEGE